MNWRDPASLCECKSGTFCRGGHCASGLKVAGSGAYVSGSTDSDCLPLCNDPLNCWSNDCVCQWHVDNQQKPGPHSPASVAAALDVAFNHDIPGPFNIKYASPCWQSKYSQNKELRCLPYAYIPGILKCATSALYDTLEKHPEVRVSYPKETHWWTRNRRPFSNHALPLHESGWLKRHAKEISGTRAQAEKIRILEGSASMFWEQPLGQILTPELVHAVTPGVRFILMLRDPAERLFSDYIYFSYRSQYGKRKETKQFTYDPEGFHLAVIQSLQVMEKCLAEHTTRDCAWLQREYPTRTQIQLGMYSEYLETWLAFFPREQFHVLSQESIRHHPRESFDSVTNFLGIEPMSDKALFGDGKGGEMKQSNAMKHKSKMLTKTRELLNEFYAPFNTKLAEMLKNPEYLWHEPI